MAWMLSVLSGASLFFVPFVSQAEDPKATCEQVAEIATVTMEGRQAGISMSQMLKAAAGTRLLVFMAERAYEEQQYRSPRYRKDAVNRFANVWFEYCYKLQKSQGD